MSTITTTRTAISPKFDNGEEFLRALGDIPLARIIFNPWPGTATEQDVNESQDRLVELIDGTLVEKACSSFDSIIASILSSAVISFIQPRELGIVGGEGYMVRMSSGNIRLPDSSFTSFDRFPLRRLPRTAITPIIPDLAVEVINSRNTRAEMDRKLEEYFDSGTRLVWIVDPQCETVEVYHSAESTRRILALEDTLVGEDVLPGFVITLQELFHAYDPHS